MKAKPAGNHPWGNGRSVCAESHLVLSVAPVISRQHLEWRDKKVSMEVRDVSLKSARAIPECEFQRNLLCFSTRKSGVNGSGGCVSVREQFLSQSCRESMKV